MCACTHECQVWISLCISVSGCRQGVSVDLSLWVGVGRGVCGGVCTDIGVGIHSRRSSHRCADASL